jgi:hypothetical protein
MDKVLTLHLKRKWYDMIASGTKTEEYREIKRYWRHRLTDEDFLSLNCKLLYLFGKKPLFRLEEYDIRFQHYDIVRLYYAYTKEHIDFAVNSISIGLGNPNWGAPTDYPVFIIKLGGRINNDLSV